LGYLQNHDQPGNRAQGERSGALLGPAQLKLGAAVLFCAPFIPLLFFGEEWGSRSPFLYFSDHPDPELGAKVREGRRRDFAPFIQDPSTLPDPNAEESFLRSKLDWSEAQREPHASILAWHRSLIALRKRLPWLHNGDMKDLELRFDEAQGFFCMQRGPLTLACNFSPEARELPWPEEYPRALLLSSEAESKMGEETLYLAGHSAMLLAPGEL
jgi:maltooligosyltrehalose trehalohydrolase